MGHPGVNSAFLIASHAPSALEFAHQSVVEHISLSKAMSLAYDPVIGLAFANAKPGIREPIFSRVIELVLSMDMAHHVDIVSQFSVALDPTDPALRSSWAAAVRTDTRFCNLVMKILAKLLDVSDGARPQEKSFKLGLLSMVEYEMQGVLETRHGLPVSPFMDRSVDSIIAANGGVLRYITLPLFSAFAEVFPLDDAVEHVQRNMAWWKVPANRGKVAATYTHVRQPYLDRAAASPSSSSSSSSSSYSLSSSSSSPQNNPAS